MKLNLPVEEYTTPCPHFVSPEETVEKVRDLMKTYGFRHVPVVADEQTVGIISDRDLWAKETESEFPLAKEIMTAEPYIVSPETPLEEVVFELSKNKFGCAVVQKEDENFLGIFTSTDALNALIEVLRGQS